MKRGLIEQMLSGMDDKYIQEAVETQERAAEGKSSVLRMRRLAAAAAACVVILGAGVSVGAATSHVFRDWVRKNFMGQEITKVELTKGVGEETAADLPLDEDAHLSLADNMEIYGERESFVCQYHIKGEEEIIDQVYSVQENGLKKIEMRDFHGKYDGVDFSFRYAIINREILGFNYSGDVSQVFHYVDGDNVYAELCEVDDETFVKGCIVRLDLRKGTVTKLTDNDTIGNMIMSPNGKTILINYRSDGYWSAFDIASRTEQKIDEINGYAHTKEIVFRGDDQVLTLGDTYKKGDVEMTGTKVIDLKTGKRVASYKQCGDYDPEWLFEQKKGKLTIRNVDGTTAFAIETEKDYQGYPHPLASRGDYVLLGNLEEQDQPFYLCNLSDRTSMKIDAFPGAGDEIGLYLASKEGKLLLTDGKEAYLVTMK